jgi:hypothetical protein
MPVACSQTPVLPEPVTSTSVWSRHDLPPRPGSLSSSALNALGFGPDEPGPAGGRSAWLPPLSWQKLVNTP